MKLKLISLAILAIALSGCSSTKSQKAQREQANSDICYGKTQKEIDNFNTCLAELRQQDKVSREVRAKEQAFEREIEAAWEQFSQEVTIDQALAPLKTTCKSMGFTEGSDPFANCVLRLQQQQATSAGQRSVGGAAFIRQQGQNIADTFDDYAKSRQQIQRPAPAINCTTTTFGYTSNTTCR